MARKYASDDLKRIQDRYAALLEGAAFTYLVVDPSVAGRKALLNLLQQIGCERMVEAKDDMLALVEARRAGGPVVALIELQLGGMGADAFLPVFRKKHPDGRAILLTAEERRDRLQPALRAGPDGFLKKPVTAEQLLAKLKEAKAF